MAQPILVVSNHADVVGGGEVSLLAMLEGLNRSRWNPILVAPEEGSVASRCRAMGLQTFVVPLPRLRYPSPSAIRTIRALRRLIRQTGAVVVHANGSRAMLYAGLAGRLAACPVVWHVRVADADGWLDHLLFALSAIVIVNSKAVARRFGWARVEQVRCVHNGIDVARFAPKPKAMKFRANLGLREHDPLVVSVGRFVAYKGYAHLLKAVELAQRLRPDVHWVFVGEGEQRQDLEAQSRERGLTSRVHFTGWVEDVRDCYASCDVFVLPSLGEHFGRVLIEAMAMGKAVVATDSGGVPEIVRHQETGLLVRPAQPEAMAQAVIELLNDPVRAAQFGAEGRRRVEKEFSLAQHVGAIEHVYEELMGRRHAHV